MNIRESLGWDVKNSLLMDGGHERPEINLKKVKLITLPGLDPLFHEPNRPSPHRIAMCLIQIQFLGHNTRSYFVAHVCLTNVYVVHVQMLQVIFWPDNIVDLFERFGVKKNFDFLSEDSDSYDFFMTEAILEVSLKKIATTFYRWLSN